MENAGQRLGHRLLSLIGVATPPSVRSQMRLLQSTKELQDQGNAKNLSHVQLITDKAQDSLPQLVASEVSGKMVAARQAGR